MDLKGQARGGGLAYLVGLWRRLAEVPLRVGVGEVGRRIALLNPDVRLRKSGAYERHCVVGFRRSSLEAAGFVVLWLLNNAVRLLLKATVSWKLQAVVCASVSIPSASLCSVSFSLDLEDISDICSFWLFAYCSSLLLESYPRDLHRETKTLNNKMPSE